MTLSNPRLLFKHRHLHYNMKESPVMTDKPVSIRRGDVVVIVAGAVTITVIASALVGCLW